MLQIDVIYLTYMYIQADIEPEQSVTASVLHVRVQESSFCGTETIVVCDVDVPTCDGGGDGGPLVSYALCTLYVKCIQE